LSLECQHKYCLQRREAEWCRFLARRVREEGLKRGKKNQ